MVVSFLSVFSLSLKKLSSLSIICLMPWLATKSNHFSSFSSLYPLSLYNLYSSGCLPIIIDVSLALTAECQVHVDISHSSSDWACLLQIFWYLLFLPPVIVFLILLFSVYTNTDYLKSLPSLSRDQSSSYAFIFIKYYLLSLIVLFLIMVYISCVLIDAQNTRTVFKLPWSHISCFFLRVQFFPFVKVFSYFCLASCKKLTHASLVLTIEFFKE